MESLRVTDPQLHGLKLLRIYFLNKKAGDRQLVALLWCLEDIRIAEILLVPFLHGLKMTVAAPAITSVSVGEKKVGCNAKRLPTS